MTTLLWLAGACVVAWGLTVRRTFAEWRAIPELRPPTDAPAGVRVRVLLPVRDEARHIDGCLAALRAQTWSELEICVIDDGSTDDTASRVEAVADEDPRVSLLRAPPLEPGAAGKPSALWAAAAPIGEAPPEARPNWLFFVDADVRLDPGAVAAFVAAAEAEEAQLVSTLPRLVAQGFWERLLQPSVGSLVLMFHRPSRVNDPRRPGDAFANGQAILARTEDYLALGGHGAVSREVLEDVALARHFKANGRMICLTQGLEMVHTEMYRGFAELWEGWRKNLVALAGGSPARLLSTCGLGLFLSWAPLIAGLNGLALMPDQDALPFLAAYVVVLFAQAAIRSAARAWPAYAPLAPLGGVLMTALAVSSIRGHRAAGRVTWKGRAYQPGAEPAGD